MSLIRNDRIVCDGCGKFIAMQDLFDGKANHHFVLPDSEFSDETFESLCSACMPSPSPKETLDHG
jgi:hypothetical protein